ncbi:DUF3987 domain-containing protein [Burkholderia vietnamiensis]|uniref:DUF3987 domain-containing protein n=1 Tax=Burkholderia vietnamiensis TaxID=60552 RepID=UPI001F5E6A0B|nr:DUF3987 domain-containing protein [Burkholderia vietnamiensis]
MLFRKALLHVRLLLRKRTLLDSGRPCLQGAGHDGNIPSFDRADDDEEKVVANARDSAVLTMCINVQDDAHRDWLDKHEKEAIASGYLFRLLMIETDELSDEGSGGQQPESALLDYDQRIGELLASARRTLETTPASELPEVEVSPEAEHILRLAQERFKYMASVALPPRDELVFAVRLAANARRIAGCMHVFERYEGSVSAAVMKRAVTIAECFGAHWLATVFPPKPIPEAVQRAQRLLDYLYDRPRWQPASWRKAEIEVRAPNFGWTKAEMNEAIASICGQGWAEVVPRIENGRRVIKLELNPYPFTFPADRRGEIPKIR